MTSTDVGVGSMGCASENREARVGGAWGCPGARELPVVWAPPLPISEGREAGDHDRQAVKDQKIAFAQAGLHQGPSNALRAL